MNHVMNVNIACKNFSVCFNYMSNVSNDLKHTIYERPFLLLGCPSMKENADECKFYKEILRFNKIDKDFRKGRNYE